MDLFCSGLTLLLIQIDLDFIMFSLLQVANHAPALCRNKGILFVAIDQSKPLSDQGPFDIVLHKVSSLHCFSFCLGK